MVVLVDNQPTSQSGGDDSGKEKTRKPFDLRVF
jgi:hypothetical protein